MCLYTLIFHHSFPDTMRGVDIIDKDYRQDHLALLQYRVEHVFLPAYQHLQAVQ